MFAIAVPFAIVLVVGSLARQPESSLSPEVRALEPPNKDAEEDLYRDIIASPYEPRYVQYDDSPRFYSITHENVLSLPRPITSEDLLSKEIDLLRRWEGRLEPVRQYPYGPQLDYDRDQPLTLLARLLGLGADYSKYSRPVYTRPMESIENSLEFTNNDDIDEKDNNPEDKEKNTKEEIDLHTLDSKEKKRTFALTPLDEGYFDDVEKPGSEVHPDTNKLMEPRKTRQNPIWSRSKSLLADNLDELRMGVTDGDTGSTIRPHHIHIIETVRPKPVESIYGTALLAAIGAAVSMALLGLVFGWYTLSKKAKAAADVDYPAYGVTGPTVDPSGDRKLAHSAHMYHYQHQKQQILAMDRSCLDRNGSGSDPESEDDNEEGDYTVYECPGLATTGNMEVKNPLFNEEPTPATPGKGEVDHPQPNAKDN